MPTYHSYLLSSISASWYFYFLGQEPTISSDIRWNQSYKLHSRIKNWGRTLNVEERPNQDYEMVTLFSGGSTSFISWVDTGRSLLMSSRGDALRLKVVVEEKASWSELLQDSLRVIGLYDLQFRLNEAFRFLLESCYEFMTRLDNFRNWLDHRLTS